MAQREILLPWDRQPQEAADVDWSSSFAIGLNSAYAAVGGVAADLSGRFPDTVTGTLPTIASSRGGLALRFNGSSNYVSMPTGALSAGTAFSKFAVVVPASFAATKCISSTTNFNGAEFRFNGSNLSLVKSGVFEVFSLSTGLSVGDLAIVGVTYDGATARGFCNGREIGSASYANTFIESTDSSLGRRGTSSELFSGDLLLHLDYGIAVQREIARDITANVWRLFAPQRIFVPVSAGGGGTTISGALGTAAASGFSGNVNANRTIAGSLGTATASGFQGTVSNSTDTTIAGNLGTATASGFAGNVNANRTIAGALGTATASGFQGTVSNTNDTVVNGNLGMAVASGLAGGVNANRTIAGHLGVAVASGYVGDVANSSVAAPDLRGGDDVPERIEIYEKFKPKPRKDEALETIIRNALRGEPEPVAAVVKTDTRKIDALALQIEQENEDLLALIL